MSFKNTPPPTYPSPVRDAIAWAKNNGIKVTNGAKHVKFSYPGNGANTVSRSRTNAPAQLIKWLQRCHKLIEVAADAESTKTATKAATKTATASQTKGTSKKARHMAAIRKRQEKQKAESADSKPTPNPTPKPETYPYEGVELAHVKVGANPGYYVDWTREQFLRFRANMRGHIDKNIKGGAFAFAVSLKIGPSRFASYMTGKARPTTGIINQIADLLGVEPRDLFLSDLPDKRTKPETKHAASVIASRRFRGEEKPRKNSKALLRADGTGPANAPTDASPASEETNAAPDANAPSVPTLDPDRPSNGATPPIDAQEGAVQTLRPTNGSVPRPKRFEHILYNENHLKTLAAVLGIPLWGAEDIFNALRTVVKASKASKITADMVPPKVKAEIVKDYLENHLARGIEAYVAGEVEA